MHIMIADSVQEFTTFSANYRQCIVQQRVSCPGGLGPEVAHNIETAHILWNAYYTPKTYHAVHLMNFSLL